MLLVLAGCGDDGAAFPSGDAATDGASPSSDAEDSGFTDATASDVDANPDVEVAADATVDASSDAEAATDTTADTTDAAQTDTSTSTPTRSTGCGLAPTVTLGGVQLARAFSEAADGERSYFLTVPTDYDPTVAHRLVVVYAGTNWSGEMIRPYFGLEDPAEPEIYVYPDLQFHDFDGWGNLGGWLLGPHARPADGLEDIEFTRELVAHLGDTLCIDPTRVFATGHSWGGDMAAVVGCFLGDTFRAVAPAAANRPYWFEPDAGDFACVDTVAVWTFFGQNETHFTTQTYPGEYGDQQDAFWAAELECDAGDPVAIDGWPECTEHIDCDEPVRYCFYSPDSGHQIPAYFTEAIMGWFRSF